MKTRRPITVRPVAPVAVKYPPFITASRWGTLVIALADTIEKKRGKDALTNSDAVRFIMAWLASLPRARIRELFPLWGQFAAAAYAWNPKTNRFNTSPSHAAALYPAPLSEELWGTMRDMAARLDDEVMPNPRLDLDGSFMDVVFQAEVRAQLAEDGAKTQGLPTGACRDKRTGKVRVPVPCMPFARVHTRPDGTCYYVDPITGAQVTCDCKGQCEPVIVDPFAPSKSLLLIALIVAAWWAYDNQPRRRRKRA